MGTDQALSALGMVGRWQVLKYILTSLAYIIPITTVYFTCITVWFAGHDFECMKKYENLSSRESFPVEFDSESGHNVYSKCERYVTSGNVSNVTETCDAWIFNPYPFQWTAVIEWDLVCEKSAYLETAQLLVQLGFLGSVFLAAFPDWFGRRRSLFVLQLIFSLFFVAAAFATSPRLLSAFQFLTMVFLATSVMAGEVITGEMFPNDLRVYTVPAQELLIHIVTLFWVLLLYLIRDLRKLQITIACLSIITLPVYRWCPESIRWLVANQRYDEAQKILDDAAKMNKLSLVPSTVLRTTQVTSCGQNMNDTDAPTIIGFLRHKRTCRYFFTLLFMIFSTEMAYSASNILVQLLSGDLFINYVIFAVLGIPGVLCAVGLMHFFGRRYTLIILHTFAGIIMAAAAVFRGLHAESLDTGTRETLVTTFALIGKFAISCMTNVNNLYLQEIFPTAIRSTGSGILMGLSITGGILGPFLMLYLSRLYSLAFPLGILSGLFFLAAVCGVTLPEVMGRPLPETIQEVVDWPRTLSKMDWVRIKRDRSLLWQQLKQGFSNVQSVGTSQQSEPRQVEVDTVTKL